MNIAINDRPFLSVLNKLKICRLSGSHSDGYEEFYFLRYNAV
jgi:hypothetical protein